MAPERFDNIDHLTEWLLERTEGVLPALLRDLDKHLQSQTAGSSRSTRNTNQSSTTQVSSSPLDRAAAAVLTLWGPCGWLWGEYIALDTSTSSKCSGATSAHGGSDAKHQHTMNPAAPHGAPGQ